jgi:hypothetical protein
MPDPVHFAVKFFSAAFDPVVSAEHSTALTAPAKRSKGPFYALLFR